jgi:hypothetical protein
VRAGEQTSLQTFERRVDRGEVPLDPTRERVHALLLELS